MAKKLENKWNNKLASKMSDPELLLYRSNLLGSDLRITNFGGGNTSQISYFKFYDITNAADVNLGSAGSTRTPCHGGARQVDTDDNDTDSISMTTTVSAGSTTARTYGMYNRKEGTDAAYYFGNFNDSSALGYARPTYTIMEVAS